MTARTHPVADLRIPADQALKSDAFNWKAILIENRNGTPLANLANCMTALRLSPEWSGVLAFDAFKLNVVAKRKAPWGEQPPEWNDDADRLTCEWFQKEGGINVKTAVAGEAVETIARAYPIHPVRDYLRSLKWDGEPRIDDWLTAYLGVSPSPYVAAVSAKWLIGGVARILRPGSKVDSMLVLEGPQGAGKSSALRIMARKDEWFTDELCEIGTKDSALQLAGRWIVEIGELAAMHRATVEKVKAFLTRQTDKFRPPYGKRVIDAPRQCIFAGSTNSSEYLVDESGNRRFWPVRCGEILIPELERDADQLWAEAVVRFEQGAEWWLTGHVATEAALEAAERYQADPWDESIKGFVSVRDSVSIAEILRDCIQKTQDACTQSDANRVVRVLKSLGWEQYRKRQGSVVNRRYRPVNGSENGSVHSYSHET